MKINIFDKALSLLLDKVSLVKPISQNDIVASYDIHMSEALTDTTYYYVRTNGVIATGEYYVWTPNGYMDAGTYTFAEDGKMIIK